MIDDDNIIIMGVVVGMMHDDVPRHRMCTYVIIFTCYSITLAVYCINFYNNNIIKSLITTIIFYCTTS